MYRISSGQESQFNSLIASGWSVGLAVREVGISHETGRRRAKILRENLPTILCRCGKVSHHPEWCQFRIANSPSMTAYRATCWKDIGQINIYIPSRPRYERPEIHNERETEIPLLVNRRFVRSFDSPINGYDDETLHNFISGSVMTPLEALLAKEEYMTGEESDRAKRIDEWSRWQERRKSAFYNSPNNL